MKRKGIWIGALLAGVVGLGVWKMTRPRIVMATQEEIRREFDARLTAPIARDQEAEDRGGRLILRLANAWGNPRTALANALAIAREGKLLSPQESPDSSYPRASDAYRAMSDLVHNNTPGVGPMSRSQVRTVADLLELTRAYESSVSSLDELMAVPILYDDIARRSIRLAPFMDEEGLRILADALACRPDSAAACKRIVQLESQRWISQLAAFPDHGLEEEQFVSYKALDTARIASGQLLAIYEGISTPIQKSIPAEEEARRLIASVPREEWAVTPNTLIGKVKHFIHEVKVRNHSNLVGASRVQWIEVSSFLTPYASAHTVREIAAAALACEAYRRKHGTWPKDLKQVCPQVPLDYFDRQPLRYDPVAGKVWSIGRDLTDNGGELPYDLGPDSRDLGVRLERAMPLN